MSKVFRIKSFLMVTMSTLALAACGASDNNYSQKSEAPMPPISEMDAAMSQPAPQSSVVGLSNTDTLTPVPANPAVMQKDIPNVAVTPEQRIAQLEQQVSSLQSDYQRIMPAFASLNTTNERIQTLLDELETSGKIEPQEKVSDAAPVISSPTADIKTAPSEEEQSMMEPALKNSTPVAAPVITTANAPVLSSASAEIVKLDTSVTAVRIGEHGSKTRIVFDLSSPSKPVFTYDLDNVEKLLIVDMPTSAWAGKESGKPNSPMIAGWTSQKGATGGAAVAIQLKKSARVLSTEFLKAEGKDPARLVMDIASGG